MKVTQVLVLCLALTAVFAEDKKEPTLDDQIRYILEGISGLWRGFEKGLYHNSKIGNDCLDTKTKTDLMNIISTIESGFDSSKMFEMFTKGMNIFNNV